MIPISFMAFFICLIAWVIWSSTVFSEIFSCRAISLFESPSVRLKIKTCCLLSGRFCNYFVYPRFDFIEFQLALLLIFIGNRMNKQLIPERVVSEVTPY